MNRAALRSLATAGAALALLSLPACAPRGPLATVDPARASAELERARERFEESQSDAARLTLGVALYRAGEFADALAALEPLLSDSTPPRRAMLYHAAAAERLEQYDVAQRGYTRYIQVAGPNPEVAARLGDVQRREARAAASAALAREQSLNVADYPEASITVTPFRIEAGDSALAPLGYGLADLVLTDLARARQLQVVERLRVDALLRELQLAASGRVEQVSAPRVGKLVGARRIVTGSIVSTPQNRVSLSAQVTDVQTDAPIGQGITTQTSLNDILAAEKTLVFRILDELRVTLTPAERAAIAEQPTRYLQAFLAYSRGVQAEARGNLQAAAEFYSQALAIDPNFELAATRRAAVRQPGSRDVMAATANVDRFRSVIDAVNPSPASLLGNLRDRGTDAQTRAQEATTSTLIIIVTTTPTPAGGQQRSPR